jgi:CRISPR-associated endoribonuclease Cas6
MPLGMTLFLKSSRQAHPPPCDGEWTGRLVAEMASRAGLPEEALKRRPAPFTLSTPLPAEGRRAAGEASPDRQGRFRLRFSWLADEDLEGLLHWAGSLRSDPLQVETRYGRMLLEDAMASPALTQRWNRCVPYDLLYEEASDCLRVITMKFYSPTTLERSGRHFPLPDPGLIFHGYATLWDAFSGPALAPGLRQAIEEHLLLADFRIQKRNQEAERESVPGFVGSATFRLTGRHPESVLKGLNVLADYAFFCGTGIGTEHGMGLTRRIPESGEGP